MFTPTWIAVVKPVCHDEKLSRSTTIVDNATAVCGRHMSLTRYKSIRSREGIMFLMMQLTICVSVSILNRSLFCRTTKTFSSVAIKLPNACATVLVDSPLYARVQLMGSGLQTSFAPEKLPVSVKSCPSLHAI